MKRIIPLFLLFVCVNQRLSAQSYFPVATTGYTYDAIAENTTALATTTGPLDGVNVLYSAAHALLVSSSYGLPNSGLLTSATKTFQLQNYTAPNMLFVQPLGGLDSLTFITPVACQSLSILDFATDAFSPTSMSVTIRFTDNSTQVFSGVTVYDWLYTAVTPFANGFDRMNRSTGAPAFEGGSGNPRFFTNDFAILCANQSKQIKRIIIKNTGTANEKLCILAVSAVVMPLTAAASPGNLCTSGGSATLTAAGLSTFTWLPAGNFAGSSATVIAVTPTATTEYTLQALSAQNCTFNAMVTVNVFSAAPTLTITNTANAGGICPTKTVMLTASGATSYSWTGGSIPVTNGVVFSPTSAIVYTVMGYNACGSSTAVTSVSVHPFPTVNPVASSPTLCSGSSLTLTATGNATNYVWSGGITNGVGFPPTATNTYTVIGTSALSCTAFATIPVTVVTTPVNFPSQNPAIVCIGGSSTLTATGATNYTWTSATQTVFTSSLVVTPTTTGITTYTVTKSNANCFDTKTISVITNSLPGIFAIVSPTLVCALSPANLAVGGGQTYIWTAPGNYTFTGASPVVTPSVPSTYTVAAYDGTCVNVTTVFLAVNPNPTIIATAGSPSVCYGHPVTLSAIGGINYTWTTTSSTLTGAVITDTPTGATAYNVTADNIFGCTSGASAVVLVNPNPTITATAIKPIICSGGVTTLSASAFGVSVNNYTWDANANGALTYSTIVNPTSPVSTTMIYTVQGHNSFPCTSSQTVQVNVFVPVLTVTGNTNTCEGGVINLVANGGNNGSYSWLTSVGSNPYPFQTLTATVITAGVYTVNAVASTPIVCPATQTVAVGVYFNPTITAVPQRTIICTKESVDLYGGGGATYVWDNGTPGGTITVNPSGNTTYTVTGTDIHGCVGTGTVLVKVSGCSGVNELSNANNGLVLYPNPNNGEFTIQANTDLTFNLVNELGQTIRSLVLTGSNNYKVSVNDLAKGIYFITGQKDNVQFNQKVIVVK